MTDEKMYPLDPGTWVVPPGTVQKLASYVQIPTEMLTGVVTFPLSDLFRPRTPQEIAAGDARRAAATAAVQAAYRAVLAEAGAHPSWAEPHSADRRCACWHRGRASGGKVTVELRHPLAWAEGVLARVRLA